MDKVISTNKITLIDKEEITESDYDVAKVSNTFFCNIVSYFNIVEHSNSEALANNVSYLVLNVLQNVGNISAYSL